MITPPAEVGRVPKPGLLRHVPRGGEMVGTQAPGEGYALTLAHRAVERIDFEHAHDRDDLALAVGLVAAKRASLIGRGPTDGDVARALEVLAVTSPVSAAFARRFSGLAHSYVAQRHLVDAVAADELVGEGAPEVGGER
jgi:hypothetical protein